MELKMVALALQTINAYKLSSSVSKKRDTEQSDTCPNHGRQPHGKLAMQLWWMLGAIFVSSTAGLLMADAPTPTPWHYKENMRVSFPHQLGTIGVHRQVVLSPLYPSLANNSSISCSDFCRNSITAAGLLSVFKLKDCGLVISLHVCAKQKNF